VPELKKLSFANALGVSKNSPDVKSTTVAPTNELKPTYKNVLMKPKSRSFKNVLGNKKSSNNTSNNTQQKLKKTDMIIEEILKIEQIKGVKNPSRLSMIEKIKKSRLTENELLELYIILAENSLNLLSEINTRYKFEIKKLLKKINDKKYTKIIKDIEKSIKSTTSNVSSLTELPIEPIEPTEELLQESLEESPAESPAESPNNSSVKKLLGNSEISLKILKKNILKTEKELSEKKLEKEKLEKELANKQNSTWQKQSKKGRNPKTIQSEIEKLNRNIKLLESSLEKNLNKIYKEILNNLKGAKKALKSIRTNMTNNKNELNEYKKINRFEEIMKELYELFNYLVKKYNFNGDEIQQKINDNMEEYKELIYKRVRLPNNRPPNFPEEALSMYT